ncbi:uncharacterized protein LOC141686051 [Apium graveolens]|uniref:uncharacterized protein LOC141686051 n=1 Tax=Apium graveolens TaxID=4045 RepID=UPI003D7B48BB
MAIEGKTKDNSKARDDIAMICRRPELAIDELTRKYPKACLSQGYLCSICDHLVLDVDWLVKPGIYSGLPCACSDSLKPMTLDTSPSDVGIRDKGVGFAPFSSPNKGSGGASVAYDGFSKVNKKKRFRSANVGKEDDPALLAAGDKEVRQSGLSLVDHTSRSSHGQDINDRGLSERHKSPEVNYLVKRKDAKAPMKRFKNIVEKTPSQSANVGKKDDVALHNQVTKTFVETSGYTDQAPMRRFRHTVEKAPLNLDGEYQLNLDSAYKLNLDSVLLLNLDSALPLNQDGFKLNLDVMFDPFLSIGLERCCIS